MYKPVRSICALFLMSFLIGSGVAPSYANSTTVTTPAEEEEVLANGNDFETDFTLSDVPAGTDYEISINGLTFLPPATGMNEVLAICASNNSASITTLEHQGGVLDITAPESTVRRYWIQTRSPHGSAHACL